MVGLETSRVCEIVELCEIEKVVTILDVDVLHKWLIYSIHPSYHSSFCFIFFSILHLPTILTDMSWMYPSPIMPGVFPSGVHADFRVVALAVPSPPWPGNPLDPPLRPVESEVFNRSCPPGV